MPLAQFENLVVQYGAFTALRGLTVEIPEGCVGLLGPNGAGKTTLIKTILGFIKPTSGTGTVLGESVQGDGRRLRQKIGLMPEQECHIPGMSAVSFVAYCGELAGMPQSQAMRRAHEVLEYCGLGEARYRPVDTFSTGMKQRVKFAQALVHGPKLLLLDEPTNGLDPSGREEMLELIATVSHGKGLSVIVSSHLMPDIERTCDSLVVIVGGQLRLKGTIEDLKRVANDRYDLELRERSPEFEKLAVERGIHLEHLKFSSYRIQFKGARETVLPEIISLVETAGTQLRGFSYAERTLEEAFLESIQTS